MCVELKNRPYLTPVNDYERLNSPSKLMFFMAVVWKYPLDNSKIVVSLGSIQITIEWDMESNLI